jgi:hypothetical protein
MLSKQEQIEAILTLRVYDPALKRLLPGQYTEGMEYADVFDVSAQEIEHYVERVGFAPDASVYENDGSRPFDYSRMNDCECIVSVGFFWKAFHFERGNSFAIRYFLSLRRARREAIRRTIDNAKSMFNRPTASL